jgi:hypothetical protein
MQKQTVVSRSYLLQSLEVSIAREKIFTVADSRPGQSGQPGRSQLLKSGAVARAPWTRSVNIEIPATSSQEPSKAPATEKTSSSVSSLAQQEDDNVLYTSVIVYDCIAKHMTWKRLVGHVKEWQVVDRPIV